MGGPEACPGRLRNQKLEATGETQYVKREEEVLPSPETKGYITGGGHRKRAAGPIRNARSP